MYNYEESNIEEYHLYIDKSLNQQDRITIQYVPPHFDNTVELLYQFG